MAASEDPLHQVVRLSRVGGKYRVDFTDSEFTSDAYIADLRVKIDQLVETAAQPHITLNFANVDHLSSAAIGELVRAHRKLENAGGTLIIHQPRPSVMAVFEVTRIHQTLNITGVDA